MEKLLKFFFFFNHLNERGKCVAVAVIFIINLKQFLQTLTSRIKYLMLLAKHLYKISRTE